MIKHVLSLVPLVLILIIFIAGTHQLYLTLPEPEVIWSEKIFRWITTIITLLLFLMLLIIGIIIGLVIREEILDL